LNKQNLCSPGDRGLLNSSVFAANRMLYWSVGGNTAAARYIHRTTLEGAAAADKVQQFVDVTDNSVSTAAVQDIVVDVKTRRYTHITPLMNLLKTTRCPWLGH